MNHIAEYSKQTIEYFLDGTKSVDFRASREPRLPYNSVNEEDVIYLKNREGFTVAKAKVTKVEEYKDLTPDELKDIVEKYHKEIKPTSKNLDSDVFNKYATFIWIEDLQEIRPFRIRNDDQQHTSWRMVDDIFKLKA